ncbi:MAG: BrnA antitoxin family protein [Steroidobacteraceae bacterium]
MGARDVSAEEGKKAFRDAMIRKTRINIHLDNDVLTHFKQLAGERGYQTLINRALRRELTAGSDATQAQQNQFQQLTDEVRQLKEQVLNLVRAQSLNTLAASADQQYGYRVWDRGLGDPLPQGRLHGDFLRLSAAGGLSATYVSGQQQASHLE